MRISATREKYKICRFIGNTKKKYVLIFVYLNKFLRDIAGNLYPLKGYIKCKKFTYNEDLRYGLSGILWGKSRNVAYERLDSYNWRVIRSENNEDLIYVDSFYNRVKVKRAMVMHYGSVHSCAKYMINNKYNIDYVEKARRIKNYEIMGSVKWGK